jgi:phosphoglycolate phosphatase-like HAD superfamily hydrolase
VSADRAVFLGAAIWDAEAWARSRVTSIGVLSGGVSRAELENAGAALVFENADDLLKRIEETPTARLATIGSC